MTEINKGTRIVNYFIDIIVISLISQVITSFTQDALTMSLSSFAIFFLYYFIFELINGRTLGKYITRSKVVDFNGKQPSFGKIFLRTLARFNPLDWLSYAFGKVQGSHDKLSRTKLVLVD